MTTFSQLVDDLVSETKRPDLVSEIATYLNQSIREVHFTPDRNASLLYMSNFRESQLIANLESGFSWEIPNPGTFQKMQVVGYPSIYDRLGNAVFAKEVIPGRHLADHTNYFYRVGQAFVFSGYGGLNSLINLGWFEYPRGLRYYPSATRPAEYNEETGWSYHEDVTTPELEVAAQALTSNWLLMGWHTVLAEGLRAKIYKRLSDEARARTSYSLYGSLRQGLWTSETMEIYGG
jgi:hypothetical protein